MQKTSFRIIFKYCAISVFFLLIGAYATYEIQNVLKGPVIELSTPANGSYFEKSFVRIKGQAYNISSLSLNGKKIYISDENEFSEGRLLFPGYNVFVMEASDKYGKKTEEILKYYRVIN